LQRRQFSLCGGRMKATIWQKKRIIIYIGGDPEKNEAPTITLELDNPQIRFDTDKNIVYVVETK
jgi:hypothetical protein